MSRRRKLVGCVMLLVLVPLMGQECLTDPTAGLTGPGGPVGPQGPKGDIGPQGTKGDTGLHCWDLNGNGVGDLGEDANGDGSFDTLDCLGDDGQKGDTGDTGAQGLPGQDGLACWDLNGNGVPDIATEDTNGDGVVDVDDCRGEGLGCTDCDSRFVNEGQANSIDGTMVVDDSLTDSDLGQNSVGSAEIAAGAVGASEIANGQVTLEKIDPSGASSGQVIKYDGTDLAWADDATGDGGSPWQRSGGNIHFNGLVGIGTDSPSEELDVVGAVRIDGSSPSVALEVIGFTKFLGDDVDIAEELAVHKDLTADQDVDVGGKLTVAQRVEFGQRLDVVDRVDIGEPPGRNGILNVNGNVDFMGGDLDVNGPLFVGGNLTVLGTACKPGGGSWSSCSDRRLKKNVRNLDRAMDRLMALRPVTFEFIDPGKINELPGTQIGMIAQEVEKVFPQWVHEGSDGYKRLTFRGFESLTVQALRELHTEKDTQIAAQQEQIDLLEARMKALEALIKQR